MHVYVYIFVHLYAHLYVYIVCQVLKLLGASLEDLFDVF